MKLKDVKIPEKAPQSGALWLLIVTYAAVGFSIYFALGVVAKRGLGLTPLIFVATGLLFVITIFTYFEGSAMLRERGGSSSFARHAFNELVAFVAGWVILLDYLIVIALAVLSVPHYLRPITGDLGGTIWVPIVIAAVVLYITILNTLDIPARRRPRFLLVLAGADLLTQLLVVAVGAFVVMDPESLTRHVELFSSPALKDVVYAAVLAMLAYAGIEAVSNLAPDLDLNPRQFTRVVTRTFWIVPLLYAAMAAVALMALPVFIGPNGPETELGTTYIEAPVLGVVEAFRPDWLSNLLQWLVAIVAAGTLIWAANTAMLGVARHTYTLAVNRQIPSWIGQLGRRYEVPYKAIIICAIAVFGLALIGDFEMLAGIYAFGATLAITIAHLSVLKLRRTMPDSERPFRAPLNFGFGGVQRPLTAVIGALLSSLALVSVLLFHDSARWVGLGWLAIGLVGYVVYRRVIEQVSLTRQVTVDAHALTRPRVSIDFHNILVPIFGTALDDDIVSTAGRMAAEEDDQAEETHSVLTILYLIEIPLKRGIKDPLPEEVADEAQRATNRAREVADEYGDVEVRVEIGRVRRLGTGIVFAARRLNADAIVMGAEPPSPIRGGARLGGIGDYRPEEIGPVTAYVLKRSPCRVLLTAPGS
ncbi:MAG: universal stress protein [Solirubrobacterales bacterium]|nr:universal stress protein [Solirubrobacterales bacterium]HMT03912.1 universal stress protein [Solirubrobacterales bacterium]